MIKENQAEFKKSNLNIWHNAEYKGQGITIVVLDDRGIPAKHINVETPFPEEHRENTDNHNTQVCSVVRETAPLSRIISMPWFDGVKKEIIDWIFEHKDDIDIINCSFGGVVGKDEFNRLKQLDIPIVCASGNNASEDKISRPARYDWTIAIGAATESNGSIAGYSNGGKELDAVAYTAIFIPSFTYGYDKVFAFNGTSCASPYACGILACYLSWRKEKGLPRLNKEEIRQFIHDNSIDMYEEGHDYKSGYGLFALPKEIPEVENNPSPSPVPETPIIEENSIDLKDIMSESDYSKYINFRNIYENATKDGNEVASKYAKDSMIELLNQYKLDSEDYIDDEVTPRPKPEEPIEEPEPPIEEPEPPIIEEPPKEEPPTEPIKPKDILIALDDGHGMETVGKRTPTLPNGTVMKENEFNSVVVNKLDIILKRCGFNTLLTAPTDVDTPLKDRIDLVNSKKANILVSVHANAYDGKFDNYDPEGVETFHYPNSTEGKKLAEIVHKHLIQGTKQINRGVKTADFFVLRKSSMPAILIEAAFMDNLKEANLLLSNSFREEVAKEIALGICEYYNVPYVEDTKPIEVPKEEEVVGSGILYRVQVGAYKNKANAEKLLDDLKKAGFDGFISATKVEVEEKPKEDLPKEDVPITITPLYRTIRRFNSDIHILELNSKDYYVDIDLGQKGKLEKVSTIVQNKLNEGKKAIAATNAGFFNFNASSEHLGMYIDEGLYYTQPSQNFIDFIYFKDGHTEIHNHHGYDQKLLSGYQANTYWAIGTSYSLIQNGKINLENSDKFDHANVKNPRTMIGQKQDGTFILVVVDGRTAKSSGLTAKEQAELMLELGCYNSASCDGGGSSCMVMVENNKPKIVNKPSEGTERSVGSVFVVYKK